MNKRFSPESLKQIGAYLCKVEDEGSYRPRFDSMDKNLECLSVKISPDIYWLEIYWQFKQAMEEHRNAK